MNIPENPIAVELLRIKDKSGNPVIELSAPIIPFRQNQIMQAFIYDDQIIIIPMLMTM